MIRNVNLQTSILAFKVNAHSAILRRLFDSKMILSQYLVPISYFAQEPVHAKSMYGHNRYNVVVEQLP